MASADFLKRQMTPFLHFDSTRPLKTVQQFVPTLSSSNQAHNKIPESIKPLSKTQERFYDIIMMLTVRNSLPFRLLIS